jgi:putative transcriptional regulator
MPISDDKKLKLERLGKHVKSMRLSKGMTLKELSNSIGKDPQSIHRLEMGQVNPSYLYLMELSAGLGVSLLELFTDLTD